ncbi:MULTISPECIES: hypothetical protein [Modestobacter]|jgi:hypothetical protein|uniref:Alkylmercury lyase n=1 Tax=Modestobacter caceresii TaxID=1522368 RepID=A0A098YCT4_9ACTN|nr:MULTISPECIES: hypothetical protein [Modestobacter]KGH48242.1 alkylmercury lyase [Modestobacter caceresii]
MNVTLVYFGGCPNWQEADARLRAALVATGHDDVVVEHRQVTTAAEAEAVQFRGSPTILVDGRDPFLRQDSPVGLSCRVYATKDGLAGCPTVDDLMSVLT